MTAPQHHTRPRQSAVKKRIIHAVTSLAIGVLALTGCQSLPDPEGPTTSSSDVFTPSETRTTRGDRRNQRRVDPLTPGHKLNEADTLVRVALLLPFSANSSGARAEAQAMLNAAELALFQIGHERIVLIPKDTKGTAPGARAAAESALEDGADVVLGPLFSLNVEAVLSVTGPSGPPVIAFSNDSDIAGAGALLMGLTPENELSRMVSFAAQQGHFRFGALSPNNRFGSKSVDVTQRTAYVNGGDLLAWEPYADGANAVELADPVRTLSTYAVKLQLDEDGQIMPDDPENPQFGFTSVVMPEGGARLLTLAPLLPRFGIDPAVVQFMGTSLWRDDRMLNEPVLEGAWFVGPDPVAVQTFEDAYEATYGTKPRRLSSLAYDAIALTSILTQVYGPEGITREALINPQGFYGSNGLFRFNPDGMSERALAVFQIRNRNFRVIDPAPTVFPPQGFLTPDVVVNPFATVGPDGQPLQQDPTLGTPNPYTDPNAPIDPYTDQPIDPYEGAVPPVGVSGSP